MIIILICIDKAFFCCKVTLIEKATQPTASFIGGAVLISWLKQKFNRRSSQPKPLSGNGHNLQSQTSSPSIKSLDERPPFSALDVAGPEWEKTPHYQYLLDTAKLSYVSRTGARMDLELTSPEQAAELIQDILDNPDSLMARGVDPAGHVIPFEITVCAVAIERLGDQTRVRAVPEAARLRLVDLETPCMDVRYGHLNPDEVLDSRPSADIVSITGSHRYASVGLLHPDVFFKQLEAVNNNCALDLRDFSGVRKDNFATAITQKELDAVMEYLPK